MASLYLHIPFCERKCIYCDFYSIENMSPMAPFISTLHKEIDLYKEHSSEQFTTIFLGGGTPSLLPAYEIKRILDHLHDTFRVTEDAEITVETNPGTVYAAKLQGYRDAGVNRLSIGVQSFHQDELDFLGRIHTANQARQCVRDARAAGFENISIDLIFSLPGQHQTKWAETLESALSLEPQHISAYSLIVEDNTPLARMVRTKLVSPNPLEEEADLYAYTMGRMQRAGFEQYEVSNYAQPGFRSQHNYNYWCHANYLGFGPSAHSFWKEGGEPGRRWWNVANLTNYITRLEENTAPVASSESLDPKQMLEERLFLGLRSDGVELGALEHDYSTQFPRQQREFVAHLVEQKNAILESNGRLRLTSKGYLVCDEICARLLPA